MNLSGHRVGYDYIGMGVVAIVDYETPDIQLDRYRNHLGEVTASPMTYLGFDRFGRIARQLWVDGNFVGTGGPPATNTNRPPLVDLAFTYDEASNRLTANNENIAQSGGLNRESRRGSSNEPVGQRHGRFAAIALIEVHPRPMTSRRGHAELQHSIQLTQRMRPARGPTGRRPEIRCGNLPESLRFEAGHA